MAAASNNQSEAARLFFLASPAGHCATGYQKTNSQHSALPEFGSDWRPSGLRSRSNPGPTAVHPTLAPRSFARGCAAARSPGVGRGQVSAGLKPERPRSPGGRLPGTDRRRGRTATVFIVCAAYDPELDRKVAIKLLRDLAIVQAQPDRGQDRRRATR